MLRRAFLERHDLAYDGAFKHIEDFDLFIRAARFGDLANLPEVLLRTRAHAEQTTFVHRREQAQTEARLLVRQLRALMPYVTKSEEEFHVQMLNGTIDARSLPKAEQWLLRLEQANRASAQYDVHAFQRELCLQSYRLHAQAIPEGAAVLESYRNSSLAGRRGREYAKLVTKFAINRVLKRFHAKGN
jgi:hypothetical protein